jgi:hypothetical protein
MKLNGVIPWGGSFDEYRRMFALSQSDLADGYLVGTCEVSFGKGVRKGVRNRLEKVSGTVCPKHAWVVPENGS